MPVAITIRNVPDRTRDELAARAAATGRSLQEYLRATLVDIADGPDAEAVVASMRRRKDATGAELSAARILALLDSDRR